MISKFEEKLTKDPAKKSKSLTRFITKAKRITLSLLCVFNIIDIVKFLT